MMILLLKIIIKVIRIIVIRMKGIDAHQQQLDEVKMSKNKMSSSMK